MYRQIKSVKPHAALEPLQVLAGELKTINLKGLRRHYLLLLTLFLGILIDPTNTLLASELKSANNSIIGLWVVPGKDALVSIQQQESSLELTIVRTLDPTLNDSQNPDLGLRKTPLAGHTLGQGFTQHADEWRGGTIYDPSSGKTYTAKLRLLDNNQLSVHGYIGMPVLGRSQIWTRLEIFRTQMNQFIAPMPRQAAQPVLSAIRSNNND